MPRNPTGKITSTKVDLAVSEFEKELDKFDIRYFKAITFVPDLVMHFGSFVAKKSFTRETTTSIIDNSIGFLFYNLFEDQKKGTNKKVKKATDPAFVRIFPFTNTQKIHFTKNAQVTQVTISISSDYLKSFLQDDAQHFQYLLDNTNNFMMEEFMTEDILRTINTIVNKEAPATLKHYYFKLKAMELLFYLFESLKKREKPTYHQLLPQEIKSIYNVRSRMIGTLNKPSPIKELKQIAGMNEVKLRRLFTQIFGMGIFEYYQHFRIQEAARLLREENLTVTETGLQMGFENLSHFTRVFEKHIGKKPKKYSSDLKLKSR